MVAVERGIIELIPDRDAGAAGDSFYLGTVVERFGSSDVSEGYKRDDDEDDYE